MIRPKQAKKILPKAEFDQFEAVIDNQVRRLHASRLKQQATIARRLRDKYRDFARHQGNAAKQKLTNQTDVSQNETRAEIFHELIERIETELARRMALETTTTVPDPKLAKRNRNEDRDQKIAAREIAEAKRREPAA